MLEFKNISYTYEGQYGDRMTLRDVSFTIAPGEVVALLGSNGGGKSTLARMSNALLLPDSGEILVDGLAQTRENLAQIRKRVGLVFQNPDDTIVSSTVYDEIAFGPLHQGMPKDEVPARIKEMLELFDLQDKAQQDPNELSGGERQRLSLAAVLAGRPNYLVLDEVTSMLDAPARAAFRKLLGVLREQGTGVLFITHNLDDLGACDRVLVLDNGALAFSGPMTDFHAEVSRPQAPAWASLYASASAEKPTLAEVSLMHSAGASLPSSDALALNDVSFAYETSGEEVLQQVSACFEPGTITLLQGESGEGKSTLLSIMAGLYEPNSGTVTCAGKALRPGEVSMLFQYPTRQLFANTVLEDVSFGAKNRGLTKEAASNLACDALASVTMPPANFAGRSPFSLSGGEQCRVALAGVMVLQSSVLLFDEPTAGLDAAGRKYICSFLESKRDEGKIIVVATHDSDVLLPIANRVIELKGGRIAREWVLEKGQVLFQHEAAEATKTTGEA